MKSSAHLFVLMFLQYAILTLNTRAIASGNFLGLFVTDIVIAALGFTILKKVAEAETKIEMTGYVLGGAIGAQFALLIGTRFFK